MALAERLSDQHGWRWCAGIALCFLALAGPAHAASKATGILDVAIIGGRVIDPETGLDRIMNVGIRGERIVSITKHPLRARRLIEAGGLVVAPGFIDLHAHGQQLIAQQLQVLDGVTTAIEAETGALPMRPYYEALNGRALINYGATASHRCARIEVFEGLSCGGHPGVNPKANQTAAQVARGDRRSLRAPASDAQIAAIVDRLSAAISQGALGIGLGIEYTPGASRTEIYRLFQAAARLGVPIFVHVRRREPEAGSGAGIAAVQEVLADAAITGAGLQLAHVHSTGLADTPQILAMLADARIRGIDVTSEAYPYTAGATRIGSEFFAEGWQTRSAITYADLQWSATGERLTRESFERLRATDPNGSVIIHMIPRAIVDLAITDPATSIASDGGVWETMGEHPRGAGTFSRVLRHYVRERGLLTLSQALAKMTILPAKRLERIAPQLKRKGRLQQGMDADITIFNPETILDRATFEKPAQASTGVQFVLVGGTFVVDSGRIVIGAAPGQSITSRPSGRGSRP